MDLKVTNANSAPFQDLEGTKQFLHHFLRAGKLYLDATNCDLFEFLL